MNKTPAILLTSIALTVTASALDAPSRQVLIETRITEINRTQIEDLPLNGRNFADFANLAPGIQGRTGSIQSDIAVLENSQFSPTTKLSGDSLIGLIDAFGDTGSASILSSPRIQLNLDPRFTGEDGLQVRISATLGSSGNANEEFGANREASNYAGVDFDTLYTFGLGDKGGGYFGLGAAIYAFEDEIPTQVDHDKKISDFTLAAGMFYRISDTVRFSTRNQLTHGGIGAFGRTLRLGVLNDELTSYSSENYLGYQLCPKLDATAGLRVAGFDQAGGDDWDSLRYSFIHEVTIPGGRSRPSVYFNGVYGGREFENPFWDVDSEFYQVNAGLRGLCGCGLRYDLGLGYEWREYDNPFYDDASTPRFQASLRGTPREGLSIALLTDYGIQNLFTNYGGLGMIDPIGWQTMFRAYQKLPYGGIGLTVEHSILEGRLLNLAADPEFERSSAQLYYNLPIGDQFTITPSLTYLRLDDQNRTEDDVIASIHAGFKF